MAIRIYNTLTGKKQEFKPIEKGMVGMYVCGVTVYDDCHIGHVRGAFTFDIVRRYFEYKGYKVKYVRNITDVDDKIIERARQGQVGQGIKDRVIEVAEKYTKSYYRDMKRFGIREADVEPRATGHIKDMIELAARLIKKGYAYEEEGDVYFDVRKFTGYGKLSKQGIDEMEAGSRVDVDKKKNDPLDFALWKSSKENEPSWDSPWGRGRPGWHIECSSMSMRYLGENFDIHGGGRDLVFPHHENEIAQSECATGIPFANYWMHNGLLTINGQKMAKSLGNFVAIREVLEKYPADVLKLLFLQTHYSHPVDFSWERMEEAKKAGERFSILFDRIERDMGQGTWDKGQEKFGKEIDSYRNRFEEAMDDDFNTAEALAVLFEMVTYINKNTSVIDLKYAKDILTESGNVLGLFTGKRTLPAKSAISKKEIQKLITDRKKARQEKDFKTADKIRKKLDKLGIILEDQKNETTWRVR